MFVYNRQVTDTLTERFLNRRATRESRRGGLRTMPPGYHYQSWMLAERQRCAARWQKGAHAGL